MSVVDWAHVILPLIALLAGVPLAWRHRSDIDAWVARLFGPGGSERKDSCRDL